MTRAKSIPVALSLVLAFATACAPPRPSPTPFPAGAYVMESWSFTFSADGTFLATNIVHTDQGTYEVEGDRLTLDGSYCPGIEGTYHWTLDGAALSFQTIQDECRDRRIIMEEGSWIKQP